MNNKIKIMVAVLVALSLVAGGCFFWLRRHGKNSEALLSSKIQRDYKIGVINDIHGKISSKKTGELNDGAKEVLSYFVDHMNNDFHPDFIIDNGDLIEGTKREEWEAKIELRELLKYFQSMTAPSYHVNGNHEMRGMSKNAWAAAIGQENSYYYFDLDGLRVIILDGNENDKVMNAIGGDYNRDFYYISEDQFAWLEKTFAESRRMQKVVFIHYPPFDTAGTKIIETKQSERLRDIFSKNKVTAVFSGHTEILDFKEIDGVRYFVFPGLERSRLKDVLWLECFSEINIKNGVAEAKLFYKKNKDEEYKTLIIPSEEFNAIEK